MITFAQVSVLLEVGGGSESTAVREIRGLEEENVAYVREHLGAIAAADEAQLFVTYFWRDQCNLAFEPATLSELVKNRVALCISCIEDSD